jgi:hypothetical protein
VSTQQITIEGLGTYIVTYEGGNISYAPEEESGSNDLVDITDLCVVNPSFEEDKTWGTTGSITLNGTTYNPCYTQSVAAASNDFPQVLPVKVSTLSALFQIIQAEKWDLPLQELLCSAELMLPWLLPIQTLSRRCL